MRYLILILFTFAATACSMTAGTGMDNLDSAAEATSLEDFQKSLQGTWERPCSYDSQNGYYKEAIAFSGSGGGFGIVTQDYFYSDANCNFETLERFQSLSVLDMENNGNLWTYTAAVATQTTTPKTAQIASIMNSAHSCGITQWTSGVTLDTTATGCNSVSSLADTISLVSGNLFRALDEVKSPTVISGSVLQGSPYTKKH